MNFSSISLTFVILLLFSISLTQSQEAYKKIIHNTDPQAKCLDGSPALLYIHEGTKKDNFLIYFIGSGYCGSTTLAGTIQDCYQRSKTQAGSSTLWPDVITQDGAPGILSLNQPVYQNWTKIIFPTCEGSLHQGSSMTPIQYKDTKLYFRANLIVRSHFKWLIQNYKLDEGSKIVLTGGSAGAVGSMVWGNYLQSIVKNSQRVFNIPDCGIFINVNAFKTDIPLAELTISNVMSLAFRDQQSPLEQCNKHYPGEEWRCALLEYNNQFLKGKMLFVNSQYDSWGINNILQIKCLKSASTGEGRYTLQYCSSQQMQSIQSYRDKYMSLANKVLNNQRGIWSLACSRHCYLTNNNSYNSSIQRVNGISASEAVYQFVMQEKINWTIDFAPWPNNAPCAY